MKNLKELEKKYAELGREIEALKSEQPIYCLGKNSGIVVKFTSLKEGIVVKQGKYHNVGKKLDILIEHTSKTIWQQLDVCPETGFYDGQLVWAWDEEDTHRRSLKFYDAKNTYTYFYNGERDGGAYDNYEPYEGNWPSWALEAFKTLER
jgi:hypothetical protein